MVFFMIQNMPAKYALPFLLAATAFGLSACSNVGRGAQRIGANMHEQSVEYDRRITKWFSSEGEQYPPKHIPDEAYCYRTLGDVTCYNRPQPAEVQRMVGKQIPDPMFDPLAYPIPEERPEAVYVKIETPAEVTYAEPTATVQPPARVEVAPAPALRPQAIAIEPEAVVEFDENGEPVDLMPQF